MKRFFFWLITVAVIFGAYLSFPRNPLPAKYASVAPPAGLLDSAAAITAGHELFLAHCAACHGESGDGQGTVTPSFGPDPPDFTGGDFTGKRSYQYIFFRVAEGGQIEPYRSQGSIMPAWKYQLSDRERWQLVAYVRAISAQP